jgi:hypothetical protein
MIFGIEPTKVDFFWGPPWATSHFFSTWKKWTPQPKIHQIEQRPARDLPGSTLTGNSFCFRMGSIPRRDADGFPVPNQIKQLKHKKTKVRQKKTKKQRRCFLQSIKVTKVTAQYWQLWTSQEQGGRNESGGISAYHNIYATKKWTHAHMAASPIFFVSNSWQFARKWCSQLLNGRIWVGWQFQIN